MTMALLEGTKCSFSVVSALEGFHCTCITMCQCHLEMLLEIEQEGMTAFLSYEIVVLISGYPTDNKSVMKYSIGQLCNLVSQGTPFAERGEVLNYLSYIVP